MNSFIPVLPVEPHQAHRPAFVAGLRDIAQCFELAAVVLAGERQHRRGFAETWERIDRDGALSFVAILGVAVDNVPQILVQRGQLWRLDRPEVGMPFAAPPVVVFDCLLAECAELGSCQRLRRDPGRAVHEPPPAFLAGQGRDCPAGHDWRHPLLLNVFRSASSTPLQLPHSLALSVSKSAASSAPPTGIGSETQYSAGEDDPYHRRCTFSRLTFEGRHGR